MDRIEPLLGYISECGDNADYLINQEEYKIK
jgi:hypothetical protein